MPRGDGEDQGPLWGRVVLLLPSILQENNAEGGDGKMQISGKISVVRDYLSVTKILCIKFRTTYK